MKQVSARLHRAVPRVVHSFRMGIYGLTVKQEVSLIIYQTEFDYIDIYYIDIYIPLYI